MFKLIPAMLIIASPWVWADEDVWYDASGKVVRVTPAEEEREAFVPDWKKRENARLEAQRTGNYKHRVRRSRTRWYPGYYPGYSGYYYGGYSAPYRCGPYRHHHHHHTHWRFRGTYHGSGWSVRIGY